MKAAHQSWGIWPWLDLCVPDLLQNQAAAMQGDAGETEVRLALHVTQRQGSWWACGTDSSYGGGSHGEAHWVLGQPLVWSGCSRSLWSWWGEMGTLAARSLSGLSLRVRSSPFWIPTCLFSVLSQILPLSQWGQERLHSILLLFLEEATELI